jgi:hypothetical protein
MNEPTSSARVPRMITRTRLGCWCIPWLARAPEATAPPSRNVSSEEMGMHMASRTPKRTMA